MAEPDLNQENEPPLAPEESPDATVGVLDIDRQERRLVTPQEAVEGTLNGTLRPLESNKIPVVLPDGTVGTIPTSSIYDTFKYGRPENAPRIITERELNAYKEQKEFARQAGEEPGQALAEGVVRGVIPGVDALVDLQRESSAQTDVELADAERIQSQRRLRAQENPVASGLGEIGGMVGSTLTPGGWANLALKAGAKGGQATGQGAARLAGRLGARESVKQTVQQAAKYGTTAAAEGAFIGVGETINEAALGETNDVAESLIANVRNGALFGLGGAVAFKAVKVGSSVAREALKRTLKKGRGQTLSDKAADALLQTQSKILKSVSGEEDAAEIVKKALGKTPEGNLLREIAENRGRISPVQQRRVTEAVKDIDKSYAQIFKISNNEKKLKIFDDLLPDMPVAKSQSYAIDKLDSIRSTLRQNIDDAFLNSPKIRQAIEQIDSVESSIMKAADSKDIYGQLDRLKRTFQGRRFGNFGGRSPFMDPATRDTANLFKDASRALRIHLEDEVVYGAAGAAQKKYNTALSNAINGEQTFQRLFKSRFDNSYRVDSNKVKTYLNKLNKPEIDTAAQALEDNIFAKQQLADVLEELGFSKIDDASKQYIAMLRSNGSRIRNSLEEVSKQQREGALLREMIRNNTDIRNRIVQQSPIRNAAATLLDIGGPVANTAAGPVLGYLTGGPLGAVAGAATRFGLKSLAKPRTVIDEITNIIAKSEIDEIAGRTRSIIPKRLKHTFKPVRKAGRLGALSSFLKLSSPQKTKSFNNSVKQIQTAVQAPDATMKESENQVAVINQVAPALAQNLVLKKMEALQFLESKIPPMPLKDDPFSDVETRVSESEMISFMRYKKAVEDPMSVFESMEAGMLSPEEVEALQAVYPNLYGRIQESAMEIAATEKNKIPYDTRVQWGILLEIPTVTALQPGIQQILEAARQMEESTPEPPQSFKGLSNSLGSSFETETTRISQGVR